MPPFPVNLNKSASPPTPDQALWDVIKTRTDAIGFPRYKTFIDTVMSGHPGDLGRSGFPDVWPRPKDAPPSTMSAGYTDYGTAAYDVLIEATRVFLMHEAGVFTPEKYLQVGRTSNTLSRDATWTQKVGWERAPAPSEDETDGEDCPEPAADRECPNDSPVLCGTLRGPSDAVCDTESASRALEWQLKLRAHPGGGPESLTQMRAAYARVLSEHGGRLPYMKTIIDALSCLPDKEESECPSACYGIVEGRVDNPLLMELIWSYWLEEAAVPRAMNALGLRFQNRLSGPNDPLGNFELGPLRRANNLIWGWLQKSYQRLDSRRRGFEYEHSYGLRSSMVGHPMGPAADRRTRFVDSFHELIRLCHEFYLRDDDTTVVSDAFPLVNALRDLHLELAQGAHNQFGDLPCQARIETYAEMWILSRPEIREFLRSRDMVPYPEPWMGQVDAMRGLQRWGTVPAMHYNLLATRGERILLSVRYGNWTVDTNPENAKNWARAWRSDIQSYHHALRTVTGLDVTAQPVAPSQRRLTTDSMRAAPRLALRR